MHYLVSRFSLFFSLVFIQISIFIFVIGVYAGSFERTAALLLYRDSTATGCLRYFIERHCLVLGDQLQQARYFLLYIGLSRLPVFG